MSEIIPYVPATSQEVVPSAFTFGPCSGAAQGYFEVQQVHVTYVCEPVRLEPIEVLPLPDFRPAAKDDSDD